jgi:hypothetical protein
MTVADIHPALRAELDRELSGAVQHLLARAAEHDGKDVIEANVDLMNDLFNSLTRSQLAAAAAGLALRLHRSTTDRTGGDLQ